MNNLKRNYDLIIIGCGSAGLSIGLFMNKAGFSVLMISKSDRSIGGDCLNEGCVPSKALLHVSKLVSSASRARAFGIMSLGAADMNRVKEYIRDRQATIRDHENASWLRDQGISVALGKATFEGKRSVRVGDEIYSGKKIVIATGSSPVRLEVKGIEKVKYYDNENIFHIDRLPERLLVIGGGPIGIEMSQAFSGLGSNVTIINNDPQILAQEDPLIAEVLQRRLARQGIVIHNSSSVAEFTGNGEAVVSKAGDRFTIQFDAVLVAIGRKIEAAVLKPELAGIEVRDNKFVVDRLLRTTNKDVLVCGDVAGDLQFSHAAEFHARIIINNLLSPIKKKLDNRYMSWATFTDPEVATFGYRERDLKRLGIRYERLDHDFKEDDRAVVDDYTDGRMVLFLSRSSLLKKTIILGGSMVAPHAGEMVQELILANSQRLSVDDLFNKIYPYPVGSRISQGAILKYKERGLTPAIKKLLQLAFRWFN